MNQNPFDNDNQFIISHELLQLFKWLFEYEQETIKKVVSKAVRNGLYKKVQKNTFTSSDNSEELQQTILDFFALFETLLAESLNEQEVTTIIHRSLMPAINHIDATACDNLTVALSAAKVTTLSKKHNPEDLKELLCKELLKRWKPLKKRLLVN
jgi:hypothetical protein